VPAGKGPEIEFLEIVELNFPPFPPFFLQHAPPMLPLILLLFILTPPLALYRLWSIRPSNGPSPASRKRKDGETCSLAVFLGSGSFPFLSFCFDDSSPHFFFAQIRRVSRSRQKLTLIRICMMFFPAGGHTYESLALISTLPLERYTPRLYIYSEGDEMSRRKAIELEATIAASSTSSDGKVRLSFFIALTLLPSNELSSHPPVLSCSRQFYRQAASLSSSSHTTSSEGWSAHAFLW